MNLFFKNNSTLSKDNIVSKTDFEQYYPAVNPNFKWASLKPHIKKATNNFILPYIDVDTYDQIESDTDDSGVIFEIKELLKQAIAEYAIYLCLPKHQTVIGDVGVVENSAENTTPISIGKMKMTRWSCITDGDTAVDQALAMMEDNIDIFPDWSASKEYIRNTTTYFKTTRDFENYANIRGRRAYISLLPHIRKAEKDIKKILCVESSNISTYLSISEPTDLQSEMITAVRSYVASLSMLKGIVQTSMVYIGDKFQLASNTDSYDTRSKMVATWLSGMEQLTTSLKEDMRDAHQDIISLLEDNPDIYADYATEHAGVERTSGILISSNRVGGVGLF